MNEECNLELMLMHWGAMLDQELTVAAVYLNHRITVSEDKLSDLFPLI